MNTRVAVPLSKEAYDAVSVISEMSGVSRGRFLADTLEAAVPSFIAIATAFRAAQAVEGVERQSILDAMSAAERKLMDALSDTDIVFGKTGSASVQTASAGGADGGADPPVTNRGVPRDPKRPVS